MAKDVGFHEDTGDEESGVGASDVRGEVGSLPRLARSPDTTTFPYGKPRPHWWAQVERHANGTIYCDTTTYRQLLAAQPKR